MGSSLVQGSSNPYYIGPSGSIEGTVTDNSGTPIANANVYYTAGEGSMGYGFYYASTDDDGKFSFINVIPGNGTIVVSARWYNDAKEYVEVTEGNTTNQPITLTPVETGSINGVVKNSETGEPIAGITVSAFPTYYFPEMMKSDGEIKGGMEDMSIVKNDEGITMQKVNPSKIKRDKARSDRKHKGKKRLTKEGEKLTKDFAGLFFPNYYMYDNINQTATDESGNYSFPKLPVGYYSVYVDLEAKSGFKRPGEKYLELHGGDAQEINFDLIPLKTGSVSGRVINPKGTPVFGAIVDIYNDSFYGYTVSDKDGNYSMISVPVGKYQITAVSQDFWLASEFYSVSVKEGENSVVPDIKFKEFEEFPPKEGSGKDGKTLDFMDKADEMMKERKMEK